MQSTRQKGLLRQMLAAILNSNLTNAELRTLARELRQGSLGEELSLLLEGTLPHFTDSYGSRFDTDTLYEIEDIIKRRRMSKNALMNIMSSTGVDPFEWQDRQMSVRDIIERFISKATTTQIKKLLDTIDSSGTSDEYLKGISGKRS